MDEVKQTCFQVVPDNKSYYERPCVFMNEGINLQEVSHVTAVEVVKPMPYRFFVDTGAGQYKKTMEFGFENKGNALKAQREFLRAFTRTGEFTLVEREDVICSPVVEEKEEVSTPA